MATAFAAGAQKMFQAVNFVPSRNMDLMGRGVQFRAKNRKSQPEKQVRKGFAGRACDAA